MSWVSDLVWLDDKTYNPATGAGSVGVEFAGSAVSSPCPYGQNITMANANNYSSWLVQANPELQWQDVCECPKCSYLKAESTLTLLQRLSWIL
jgi:alkaline phosphatase D